MSERKESDEERMFEQWCKEAIKHGLLQHFVKQPKPFDLTPAQFVFVDKQLKTKVTTVKRSVCRAHIYTADFCLMMTPLGMELLKGVFQNTHILGFPDDLLWVDTKGGFMSRGTGQEFAINQKLVYDKYEIWVSKVVPFISQYNKKGEHNPSKCLFVKTWCPEQYRWISGRKRPTMTKKGQQCPTVGEFISAYR